MRCLVTGGAGFIGSHLSRALLNEGIEVRIVDNFLTGKLANIRDIQNDVELFQGNILNLDLLAEAMDGVCCVFHQAALPSVRKSIENPLASNANNIDGTLSVLWAARMAGVRRVVYASSSSVYGDTPVLPKVESMPAHPQSPYALTKFAGEVYCRQFFDMYGLETICLRYFNVFGPDQDAASEYSAVIPKFISIMMNNGQPAVHGTGRQTRDFCYVDNVVAANLLALKCPIADGQAMNIGCGEQMSVTGLIDELNRLLGKRLTPVFLPARKGDIQDSLADYRLAKERLGYSPLISVREGLAKLIDRMREERQN